jgi:hypothetical protein
LTLIPVLLLCLKYRVLDKSSELKPYYLLLSSSSRHFPHTPKLSEASFVLVAIIALFALSALAQASVVYAASSRPTMSVSSGGAEEPYIVQQVASASNPNQVYQITGASLAQRVVGGAYKSYFYLYINAGKTFATNTTGQTAHVTLSGYNTNNFYWNVQSGTSGGTGFCGTIGQDLDTGATSDTLSEWQWSDLNWGCGRPAVNLGGSYDGGGPTACYVYSNNQDRESVYVIIVDSSTHAIYSVTGAELIQQSVNGVQSTTYIALVSGSHGKLVTSGDQKDCPTVTNPISSPSLRWYVRSAPVKGKIPGATITGNFGITGTLGAGISKAPEDGNMIFNQFVDRSFQTGYIPNRGGPTDISILKSTDPVSGATANWPG